MAANAPLFDFNSIAPPAKQMRLILNKLLRTQLEPEGAADSPQSSLVGYEIEHTGEQDQSASEYNWSRRLKLTKFSQFNPRLQIQKAILAIFEL